MSVLESAKYSGQTQTNQQNVLTSFQGTNNLCCIPMASSVYRSQENEQFCERQFVQRQSINAQEVQIQQNILKNIRSLPKRSRFNSEGKQKIFNKSSYSVFHEHEPKRKQKSKSGQEKLKILQQIAQKLSAGMRKKELCLIEKKNIVQPIIQVQNVKSTKLVYLLKDIKEYNKQNSKPIYSIKKVRVKNASNQKQVNQIHHRQNVSILTYKAKNQYKKSDDKSNAMNGCKACGCMCQIKERAKGNIKY